MKRKGNQFLKEKVLNTFIKNIEDKYLTFRSKWEKDFAKYLESHKNVKSWKFDFPFRYFDEFVSKKNTTYYIDFKVELNDGRVVYFEVKPVSQLNERVNTRSSRYKKIHTHNYLKNLSKFDSVVRFCKRNNNNFYLVQKDKNKFSFYRWNEEKHLPEFVQ